MTLKSLDELESDSQENIVSEYRFRSQIDKEKWLTPFEIVLPNKYFGKTYLIDAKSLARKRSDVAFSYENSLEQYMRLKEICPDWKTELDLFYLWDKNNWTTPNKEGKSRFLLVPSTLIPKEQRDEIVEYGLINSGADEILL